MERCVYCGNPTEDSCTPELPCDVLLNGVHPITSTERVPYCKAHRGIVYRPADDRLAIKEEGKGPYVINHKLNVR